MKVRTPRLRRIHQLSVAAIALVILWVFWFHIGMDLHQTSDPSLGVKKSVMFNSLAVGKKGKRQKTDNTLRSNSSVLKPVELPKDLNSIDLSDYTLFGANGDNLFANLKSDYHNGEELASGLTFKDRSFFLNGLHFRIFSGSMHYFRIVPEHWKDRLKKMKACGLNTIDTYVPWNLHEPSPGVFNFEGILNLRKFLTIASELGFYVILRPGPYICSEFEYGGLPGWLLADPTMEVRTNHRGYINAVNRYLSGLLPKVLDLQFTEGGPIIMFQVENEYASFGQDPHHVKLLYYIFRKYGIKELIVTSDNSYSFTLLRDHPEFDISQYALHTINTDNIIDEHIKFVQMQNLHVPLLVMELWSGWFDHWTHRQHHQTKIAALNATLGYIFEHKGSFNLYMFIGGTNFGFTNGALNLTTYLPVTTSYDYDALLTEAGDTTPKYYIVRNMMLTFYRTLGIPYLLDVPPNLPKAEYGTLNMMEILEWNSLIKIVPMLAQVKVPNYMETYKDLQGRYHTMGYIVYSHVLRPTMDWTRKPGTHLVGYVKGRLTAMLDGDIFYAGSDHGSAMDEHYVWDKSSLLPSKEMRKQNKTLMHVDFMIENQGRINFVKQRSIWFNLQHRGMKGPILKTVFGIEEEEWSIKILHFEKEQCQLFSKSKAWMTIKAHKRLLEDRGESKKYGPALYRTYLDIEGEPQDTFINFEKWRKGIIIVNSFNLGRYWHVGPQKTLYLPGPLLKKGRNEILIFEEQTGGDTISFQQKPEWTGIASEL